MKTLKVAIIGTKFMGKAHSNAWLNSPHFFDVHAYVSNWWPPGHTIGYKHEFHHAVVDFVKAIVSGCEIRPNFVDGVAETKVLEAALKSAETGQRVSVS